MAKRALYGLAVVGIVALSLGCATMAQAKHMFPAMKPVAPPSPGYALKVDNLLVIADISRSMRDEGKFATEKSFLESFNGGIPNGLKNSGMRTFGKSAYYDTVLVQPIQGYDRAAFGGLIADLKAGCGNTPLARALVMAQKDLEDTSGPIAILVVSDGENLRDDPVAPAMALSETYGNRLCIYTVHVGDCEMGRQTLQAVATHSGCGAAMTAADLASEAAMKKFITEVFFKHEAIDSDGDGVLDDKDECPNTPKGVQVDKVGCPLDTDGDGIPDYEDKCPDTPKGVKVDEVGCPLDTDGDGVPDYKDECPGTPKGAPVNAVGCWIVKGLLFDYDKWDIKAQYFDELDVAVKVLDMNPSLKVQIQGHTDSMGSDGYNQTLSEKRAGAVRDYIVSKGISADRLTVKGFGESKPVDTNDTPEGRAQNRRVQLDIMGM
jgi:OOP family OmpA-OmpF porin